MGSKPAGDGRFGQAELAGNHWEWTLDMANGLDVNWGICAAGTPCTGYDMAECDDCAYLEETLNHVTRGGSTTDAPKNKCAVLRDATDTYDAADDVGMRCARVPR